MSAGYQVLVYVLIAMGAIGLFYVFASDTVDYVTPQYSSSPLSGYNTPESNWGLDTLIFMFKMVLAIALIALILYTLIMQQKPEQPWR